MIRDRVPVVAMISSEAGCQEAWRSRCRQKFLLRSKFGYVIIAKTYLPLGVATIQSSEITPPIPDPDNTGVGKRRRPIHGRAICVAAFSVEIRRHFFCAQGDSEV